MPGKVISTGSSLGTTVEVSEIESLTDGHIIIGDGSGAPTTYAAFASATGKLIVGANFPAGTVGAPSVILNGDTTTGWYQRASTCWNFSGGGVAKIELVTAAVRLADAMLLTWGVIGTSVNVGIARNGAGVLEVNTGVAGTFAPVIASEMRQAGANGQRTTLQHATSSATVTAGASFDFANLIPAGSVVIGVTIRITTTIESGDGGTSIAIGDGTDVDRWGTGIAMAAGTTTTLANATISALPIYAAATAVRLTINSGTFNGTGVCRATVHYINVTAATS